MRLAEVKRKTKETDVVLKINLDGEGNSEITTGIDFLDHMLNLLACHANFDLKIQCKGDLNVDDHHTAEDCAIVLGEAFKEALGDKKGIKRFGYSYAPMDESLSRSVVDISGRAYALVQASFKRERLGALSTENILHFMTTFANSAMITLHVDIIRGENDHHKAESIFKALALSLKEAVAIVSKKIPSTKGCL